MFEKVLSAAFLWIGLICAIGFLLHDTLVMLKIPQYPYSLNPILTLIMITGIVAFMFGFYLLLKKPEKKEDENA